MRVVVVTRCHPLLTALGFLAMLPIWLLWGVGWLYWQLAKALWWLARLVALAVTFAAVWLTLQVQAWQARR